MDRTTINARDVQGQQSSRPRDWSRHFWHIVPILRKMVVQIKRLGLSKPSALIFLCMAMLLSLKATRAAASSSTYSTETSIFMAPLPEFGYVEVRVPDLPPLGTPAEHLPLLDIRTTRLVLRLGQRRVYIYKGDDILTSYPVAIGRSDAPTPTGEFEVFQMIENPIWQSPWTGEVRIPGPNSALGLRWIGFVRMSNGIIGFHGTPTLSSIGRAASNGCVRMRNEDVVTLFEQIEMGTLVVVEP